LATLGESLAEGRLPNPAPEGRCRGELITPSLHPWVDACAAYFALSAA
jgi:hypothetical protein